MVCYLERDDAIFLRQAGQTCSVGTDCCSTKCSAGTCAKGRPCHLWRRNGYCTVEGCTFSATLTSAACDLGSTCNKLYAGGLCQKKCTLKAATDCRGLTGDYLGDYECRAWNRHHYQGVTLAATPVCDFGPTVPCDWVKGFGQDCGQLADQGNPTNMSCRDLKGNTLVDKYSAAGLCLDNTASGPVK